MMGRQHGVTLMELMVVVVIVGVLAAVAYPSYRAQVRRSNRTEARVALEQTAGALEKCYTRYMIYNDNTNCPASNQFTAGAGFNTPRGLYRITAVVAGSTFTVSATPQGAQATDSQCMTFSLTETGVRAVSGSLSATPAQCW
jgi:type IV pilus assembly protein PilE